MRILMAFLLLGVFSLTHAQIAPGLSAINRNTVLDLLVFLAPGFIAIKFFQWVWTALKKRSARINSLRLELVHLGTLIFTLLLSLLAAWAAASLAKVFWPDRTMFTYMVETPLIGRDLFESLLFHTFIAILLGGLAAVILAGLDDLFELIPVPVKKPWAKLWEDRYDEEKHMVHVTFGKVSYLGKLCHVDASGDSRDLVLEKPLQYFDSTFETVPVGEFLLLRDVQQHQVRLINLEEEREAMEKTEDPEALIGEEENHQPGAGTPYSGGGGDV